MHDELREAVERGDVDRARAALEAGASPHLDSWGLFVIDEALDRRDERMARLLMEFGVTLRVDAAARTELHRAASRGDDPDLVGFLVRLGLDPNATDSHGWTPLHCAAAYGYERVASALVAAGADPGAATAGGKLPADLARANGHPYCSFSSSAPVHRLRAGPAPGASKQKL